MSQKRAASYISSRPIYGPPQVAANTRAQWIMGQSQDTYLQFETAGDQYIGCVGAGIPSCFLRFAVLSPQFDCFVKVSNEITKIVLLSIPVGLNNAGKFLSVSLIVHLNVLEDDFNSSHTIAFIFHDS